MVDCFPAPIDARADGPLRISGALQALAGECADDLAQLFPFPHQMFFRLSPARMHLLGLALAGTPLDLIRVERLTARKWADAARMVADPPPVGLEGVLGAIDLPMWSRPQYWALWAMAQCPKARKVLLHAENLTPNLVAILAQLPPGLRAAKIVAHVRRPMEAKLLAALCATDGDAERLMAMAKNCNSRSDFYGHLADSALGSDEFPAAPLIDHADIQPIANVVELRRAAIAFGNCLRDLVDGAVNGLSAYYVYRGPEPAVIAIAPRFGGRHVIEQISGLNNDLVSGATKQIIRAAFAAHGVADRRREARRATIDVTLSGLQFVQTNSDQAVDDLCRGYLEAVGEG